MSNPENKSKKTIKIKSSSINHQIRKICKALKIQKLYYVKL